MKIYPYLLLVLLVLVLSCSKHQEVNRFEAYCSSIKVISTPFSLWCGIHEEQFHKIHQDTSMQRIFHLPENLAGRLYPEESFITLLFGYPGDYMIPDLYTFTKDGAPIDTLRVGGSCFADPGYNSSSLTFFESNLTFTVIDTTRTIAIDSAYQEIKGTDSLFIMTVHYKLDKNGRFSLIDSNKIYILK
jgi:hypothetical protein